MARDADVERGMNDALILEEFLPYRLNRAAELVSRSFAQVYGEMFGLTRPEWRCLAIIGEGERTTATEIGRRSDMHKTKVSRAVYALEKRKWLKRETDPDDRRTEHLSLTPAGLKAYGTLAEAARNYERELERLLGASAAKLRRGLDGLDKALIDRGRKPRQRRRLNPPA